MDENNINNEEYNNTGREQVDEVLDNAAAEYVHKQGVPRPFARAAVKNNGGLFSPLNTPANRLAKNRSRNMLGRLMEDNYDEEDAEPNSSSIDEANGKEDTNLDNGQQNDTSQTDSDNVTRDNLLRRNPSLNSKRENDKSLLNPKNKRVQRKSGNENPKSSGLNKKNKVNIPIKTKESSGGKSQKGILGNGGDFKSKILGLIKRHPVPSLIVIGVALVVLLILLIVAGSSGTNPQTGGSGGIGGGGYDDPYHNCEKVSISKTRLSQEDFGNFLKAYKEDVFYQNYETVHSKATGSGVNPEIIVINAVRFDYNPNKANNYWKYGCLDDNAEYKQFDDFESAVDAYIKYLHSFSSVEQMLYYEAKNKCFNPDSIDSKEYVDNEFQKIIELRKSIFNLSDDDCYDFQFNYSSPYPIDPDSERYKKLFLLHDTSFEEILKNHGYSIDTYNEFLLSRITKAGIGTRDGVVEAAVSLIGSLSELGIKLNYRWGGKYAKIGGNPDWGKYLYNDSCDGSYADRGYNSEKCKANYMWISFDCSGFVTWAVINGMQDSSIRQGDTYSGKRIKLDPNEAICKPGSVLDKLGAHIALVVGVDSENKKYIVAESTGSNLEQGTGGVKFSYYDFGANGYDCINMENIYGE